MSTPAFIVGRSQYQDGVYTTQVFADGSVQASATYTSDMVGAIPASLMSSPGDTLFQSLAGAARLPIGTEGQVKTVVNGLPAWVTPAASGATQRQLVSASTIGSALISLPINITWATPFADNNYVVNANVEIGEPSSDGAVTSIICIASVQKQAAGVGVVVTVANADSIPHACTINISATHL